MKIDTTRARLRLPANFPKELFSMVFRMVVEGGWSTDQIRLVCGVIDQMDADKKKRGQRGPGKHHAADAKAVQFMLAHCYRSGETSPRALAAEAVKRGYGGKGNSAESDIVRLAAKLRRSLYFEAMKNK